MNPGVLPACGLWQAMHSPCAPGCWNLRLLDLLSLLGVAGNAECLGISLRKHDFAILRGLVAGVAGIHSERRMGKRLHQLGLCGLMGIVALHAIGGGERLSLVSLDQALVLRVVAVEAKRGRGFGQVIVEL